LSTLYGYRAFRPVSGVVGRVTLGLWELEGKIPTTNETFDGNALDNYPLITLFRQVSEILLIQTWDENLSIQLSQDGVAYQDELELDPGLSLGSWLHRYAARGFSVKNTTPGSTARYQIVAFS
jgi:hypothetical protein